MSNLRDLLFQNYHSTHTKFLIEDGRSREVWFDNLVRTNYSKILSLTSGPILEIGCGQGELVKAVAQMGHADITGIDLSEADITIARQRLSANFIVASAFDFLPTCESKYGLVIAKDVLEHIEVDQLVEFLTLIRESLLPGGRAILQVPNMDWLLASHERYMDLTHTTGFTRESLGQICRLVFGSGVEIQPVWYDFPKGTMLSRLSFSIVRPLLIRGIREFLNYLGGGLGACWFEFREIAAVCQRT